MSVRQARRGPAASAEAERAQHEETVCFRAYLAWRRSHVEELLAGPLGAEVRALRAFLRRLAPDAPQPVTGRDLVEHVRAAAWLRGADDTTRARVRWMIGQAIRWAKARRGLDDDDPLPGEPQSARQAIAELLRHREETPP